MAEFKIVERSHIPQGAGRGKPPSELSLTLARGEVVFVAHERGTLPPAGVMNLFAKKSYLRLRGLQPHTRQGIEDGINGLYVWAERVDSKNGS